MVISLWKAAATLTLIAVGGCAHQIPIAPDLPPEVGAETPSFPVTVGVYFSDDFRGYVHQGGRGGDTWVFPLGGGSVPLFEAAFARTFAHTLPVAGLPPLDEDVEGLDAVIEPSIEDFYFDIPFLKTGDYVAEITYRFTLYSTTGDPFASWAVDGYAAKPGELGFEFARWPGEAADLAMEDAAGKFVEGIAAEPEVQRWLRQRSGGDG